MGRHLMAHTDIILAALLAQRDRIDEAIAQIQAPPRKRKQSEPGQGTKQRRVLELLRKTPGLKARQIALDVYGNEIDASVRGAQALIRQLSLRGRIRRVRPGFWVDVDHQEGRT
jgi:hypothetical protein